MPTHGEHSLDPNILLSRLSGIEQRAQIEHQALKENLGQRMDSMELSLATNHAENIQRSKDRQDAVTQSIDHLSVLIESKLANHEERFKGIGQQFSAFERFAAEQHQTSLLAISKSEMIVNKQLDQIGFMLNNLPPTIEDVKQRIDRVESIALGRKEARDSISGTTRTWMSVIGTVAAIIGAIVGYVLHTHL